MTRLGPPCRRAAKILLALAALFTVALFVAQKKPRPIDASRIALIETSGRNHLFRGSNPFEDKNGTVRFSYDRLTQYFNATLEQSGKKKLDDYYLIDVSLLDIDEYQTIDKESRYFQDNPQHGYFLNVSTISPNLLLTPFDNGIARRFTDDYNFFVAGLLNKIRELARLQKDRQVVVYIHCNAGRDRTGFVVAAYRMLFEQMMLKDAVMKNIAETGRSSEGLYSHAISSFCRYINMSETAANTGSGMCERA